MKNTSVFPVKTTVIFSPEDMSAWTPVYFNPHCFTAKQVAIMYGITPQRVRSIARKRNIGQQTIHRREWIFQASDVLKLAPGPVGRPKSGIKATPQ